MKWFCVVVFFGCMLLLGRSTAQNRCVVYTLDESGSMSSQYYIINQNLQLLVGLLDPKDELYIIRGGERPIKIDLNAKNKFTSQIRGFQINGAEQGATFQFALDIFKKTSKTQKFLIFAGDGFVTDFPPHSQNALLEIESKKLARHIILGIDPDEKFEESQYYQFVKGFSSNEEIIVSEEDDLDAYMEKLSISIIGSSKGIKTSSKDKVLTIENDIPVAKLIVMVQNINSAFEPEIAQAIAGTKKLKIDGPFKANREDLYGAVYHLSKADGKSIPKGKVSLTFDGELKSSLKVQVLPIVMVEVDGKPSGLEINRQVGNRYFVCKDVKSVNVLANLSMFGKTASPDILSKTNVYVEYMGKREKMSQSGKGFALKIPYTGTSPLTLNLIAEMEGYFNKKSRVFVVERDNCFMPSKLEVSSRLLPTDDENPGDLIISRDSSSKTDKVKFIVPEKGEGKDYTLKLEMKELNLVSEDGTKKLIPLDSIDLEKDFELEILESELPVSEIKVVDNKFQISFASNPLCNCFINTDHKYVKYRIKSKNMDIDPFEDQIPVEYVLEPWWIRCQTLFIIIAAILALIWYVIGIIRKPRFGNIQLQRTTAQYGMPPKKQRYVLRTNWFNRYLIPYIAEKNTVDGLKLIATRSKNSIEINKRSLKGKEFDIGTVNTENLSRMSKVKLSFSNPLEIQNRMNKKTYELLKV